MDHESDDDELNISVYSPVLILSTHTECWKCGEPLKVIAIGGHTVAEDGEFVIECSDGLDMVVLSDVSIVPEDILHALLLRNPDYGMRHSHTAGDSYYANNCKCGAFTGDFYLHAEPGGAFFPTSIEDARGITVERLDVVKPAMFSASWGGGTGDFILAHAKSV